MNQLPRMLMLAVLPGILVWAPASGRAAGPDPDPPAESQTYEVELKRGGSVQYEASLVFLAASEEGRFIESGDLGAEVFSPEGEPLAAPAGTWFALDFGWLGIWCARADTDGQGNNGSTGGRFFFFGVAFGDRLYAKVTTFDDPSIAPGRFRLAGTAVAEPDPQPPQEPAEDDPPDQGLPVL